MRCDEPDELLLCPFCGGRAEVYSPFPNADNPTFNVEHERGTDCPVPSIFSLRRSRRQMVNIWNNRTTESEYRLALNPRGGSDG